MVGDQQRLFSFGLIADAQYADLPDGNCEGRVQRFREVPAKLRAALASLRAHQPPLQCVLHLGDIVNGRLEGGVVCWMTCSFWSAGLAAAHHTQAHLSPAPADLLPLGRQQRRPGAV